MDSITRIGICILTCCIVLVSPYLLTIPLLIIAVTAVSLFLHRKELVAVKLPRTTKIFVSAFTVSLLISVSSQNPLLALLKTGSLVFRGGHVVLPLLQADFVTAVHITRDEFLAGYGFAQALPGPLFSISANLGAHATPQHQILGGIAAACLIFLPSFFLIWATMPLLTEIQKQPKKLFDFTNAAVTGILAATLINPIFPTPSHQLKISRSPRLLYLHFCQRKSPTFL